MVNEDEATDANKYISGARFADAGSGGICRRAVGDGLGVGKILFPAKTGQG